MKLLDFKQFADRGRAAQTAADQAKTNALKNVTSNNKTWLRSALKHIDAMGPWEGTGEDLRHIINRELVHNREPVAAPSHANAWGSLVREALARGMIERTGRWLKMKDKGSHARLTPEYRRKLPTT